MMNTKKYMAIVLIAALAVMLLGGCSRKEGAGVNIGILAGNTGVGASYLWDQAEAEKTDNIYKFTLAAQPQDIAAQLTSGTLDIAALPTNLAANLYAKSDGNIRMVTITALGVLYILENGNTVNSIADLKGKTIYTTGQGSNPEFVLNYLLSENGLTAGTDVEVVFLDNAELSAKMASGEINLCMLPCPASTGVIMKNKDVRVAVNINDEWNKAAENDSKLTMSCIVVRTKFAKEHKDAVSLFISEYAESIKYVNENPAEAAKLVEKYGITASAAVAEKAIPDCALVSITGKDMKPAIEDYLKVLYDANPASVGGSLPDDSFYYCE